MTIFDLHSAVLADSRDVVRSFLLIADELARQFVIEEFLLKPVAHWVTR